MTPLVLVHGFLGGGAQWAGQVAALSDIRDVIAVDLPGFGAAADQTAPDTIDGFAQAVLDDLSARGITEFDLLGHSMGGMIVQQIMRKEPTRVKRLVLYGTGPEGVLPGRFETIAESKRRASVDGVETTAARISATWFRHREKSSGYPACAAIAAQAGLQAVHAGLDAMEGWSGADNLARIACPTLVLWGDRDRSYNWDQVAALWQTIPNASLAVMPGCSHAVHLEKPDWFNAIVRDFLTG